MNSPFLSWRKKSSKLTGSKSKIDYLNHCRTMIPKQRKPDITIGTKAN